MCHRARNLTRNLGMRVAAGFLRNRQVSFDDAHMILLGRPPRFWTLDNIVVVDHNTFLPSEYPYEPHEYHQHWIHRADRPQQIAVLDKLNVLSCEQSGRTYHEAQRKRNPIDKRAVELRAIHNAQWDAYWKQYDTIAVMNTVK